MDAKISKERLSRLLSYDWLKIVAFVVLGVLLWSLIFTVSATKITPSQQFTAINYFGNNQISANFGGTLSNAFQEDVFSYEVIELTTVDALAGKEQGNALIDARLSTAEGDVIFVPDIPNPSSKREVTVDGETQSYYDSYLQTILTAQGRHLAKLDPTAEDGFFKRMETFVNRYYTNGDYANGVLDEQLVEQDFRARIKKNRDKRFKKETQIQEGVLGEIDRIRKYAVALVEFYGYLNEGLVTFTHATAKNHETGTVYYDGVYFINLCPNVNTMGNLKNIVSYEKTITNEESGESQILDVAENMNVAFCDFEEVKDGFVFESLLYVNYLIRVVKNA